MGHFPLLLIIPADIYYQGKYAMYEYINYMMHHFGMSLHNQIYDWYTIGGQWNLCFSKSLNVDEYVDIELELVSTLRGCPEIRSSLKRLK